MMELVWLILLGVFTGTVGGALGLGGGFILVPVFHIVFKWSLIQSVAASQFCILATSVSATQRYLSDGQGNVRLGVILGSTTIVGAAVGAGIANVVPEQLILTVFTGITLLAGVRMWRPTQNNASTLISQASRQRLAIGAAGSGFVGVAAGLLGVGGGVLQVPIMHIYLGEPIRRATATSAFIIGLTATASAAVYFGRGDLDVSKGAVVALGILFGSHIGAACQSRIPVTLLKRVFATFLMLVAARMIGRAFGW